MSSSIIAIADALVLALNAATFSQSFTATREYQPIFDLSDLSAVQVSIVPKSVNIDTETRQLTQRDYDIDVGIQMRTTQDSENDDLMALTEEIADFFRGNPVSTTQTGTATLINAEIDPIFAPSHLTEQHVFTSVIKLTFRALQ